MNLPTPFEYLLGTLTFFINLEPLILFLLTALIIVTIILKALGKVEGPEEILSLIAHRAAEILVNSLVLMLLPLYIPVSITNVTSTYGVIAVISLVISFISQLSIISMEFRKEKSPLLKELENKNISNSRKKAIFLFIDTAPTILAMITLYLITFLTFNLTAVYLTNVIVIIIAINSYILGIDALIGGILHIIEMAQKPANKKPNIRIRIIS
ncbi:MAG: hypothetical protein RXQ77_04005 [Candidatus Nanopusillus sp.]